MELTKNKTVEGLSEHLQKAWLLDQGVEPLTTLIPKISVDEAYAVQLYTIQQAVQNGAVVTGKKIGLTSRAMQLMLGVDEPDYGHLLQFMHVPNRGTVLKNQVLQPKVEGEIAFVLKSDLKGPNITEFDVILATDYIVGAVEIVDSRIKDWKITLADTVADNASSGLYILGDIKKRLDEIDIKQIGMVLYKNNELQNTGVSAATLGNPLKCVAWLANKLSEYNVELKAGEIILSGALSAAINAQSGDEFTVKFSQLGEVKVAFE